MDMRHLTRGITFVAVVCASGLASAADRCQSASHGTYPIVTPPGYEHDRFGISSETGDKHFDFGGFVSYFDGSDDDTGDGSADLLMIPEWVAYEMRRFVDDTGRPIPPPGLERPRPWHELEDLVADRPGQEKLDASYEGVGRIWSRGHMATRSPCVALQPLDALREPAHATAPGAREKPLMKTMNRACSGVSGCSARYRATATSVGSSG